MVLFDLPCLYPYRPREKNIFPTVVGAGIGLAGTILNNQLNKQNSQYAWKQQVAYNNMLLNRQTQMHVHDARSAGLNPAFMNGSQLGSTPSPPSYDTPVFENPISPDTAMMFGRVAAETRKTNADAEAQELLNEDKKAKNAVLNQETRTAWMLDGKELTNEEAQEYFDNANVSDDVKLPEFVKLKDESFNKGSEGRFEGRKILREWRSKINELDAQDLKNELLKMVTSGQINSPAVVSAITNMPKKEFDQLCEIVTDLNNYNSTFDTRRQILEIELDMAKLQKEIQEDSNLYQYINKMFDGEFEWKDFGKLLAMTLVGLFQNIGGIGVGLTNLKGLGSPPKPARVGFS